TTPYQMQFSRLSHLFTSNDACFEYLDSHHVFYKEYKCAACQEPMIRNLARSAFRCPRFSCRREESIKVGTLFHHSKLQYSEIMLMAYFWLNKVCATSIITMTGHSSRI